MKRFKTEEKLPDDRKDKRSIQMKICLNKVIDCSFLVALFFSQIVENAFVSVCAKQKERPPDERAHCDHKQKEQPKPKKYEKFLVEQVYLFK